MQCDPNTLSRLSSCIRCLTDAQLAATRTYLLCQWLLKLSSGTPNAPTNADITPDSGTPNITVTWTNPSPMGSTNEVWRSIDGGATYLLFTTVAGSVSQIVDHSVQPANSIWYYKIRTCSSTSCSAFTDPAGISQIFSSANVASINLPFLVQASGSFQATGLAALTNVSLPKLHSGLANIDISNNPNLTSITLTSLKTVGGGLLLGSDKITGAFSLPSLVSVNGGDLQLQSNTLMTSLSAPLLTTIFGIGSFSGCSSLTAVNLNSLQSTGDRLDFNSDTSLTSINLPALTSVGADVVCNGCTLLQSVSLTNLTAAGGNFTCNACPALTTFSIPVVVLSNGFQFFTWNGDALLAASVNQVLARGVASAVNTGDFELSAGTNAAPTGQGVADKATLIGAGNTVVTN
jgi:hypothetical protein